MTTSPLDSHPDDEALRWLDEAESAATPARLVHAQEVEQLFTHNLLLSLHESGDRRERRIARVLERFDAESAAPLRRPVGSSRQRLMWLAACAAAVACGGAWWWVVSPAPAEAAVERLLSTLDAPVTRVYQVTIQRGLEHWPLKRHMTLFTQSIDRFVIEAENAPIGPVIFGGDGYRRWGILGTREWTSSGADEQPTDLALQTLADRSLNLNRLLRDIPHNYACKLEGRRAIPGFPELKTRPIYAELTWPDRNLPHRLRIWPHPETGVVMLLESESRYARFAERVRAIELRFDRELVASPEFFSIGAHRGETNVD